MQEVQEGLFAVKEQMPCLPKAIYFRRYELPSTLDESEQEEAAARILFFSQELGQWVGVSWHRLTEMLQKDYETFQTAIKKQVRSLDEQEQIRLAIQRYHIFCIVTFGIYGLFAKKPTIIQEAEVPLDENIPFSGIFLHGSRYVIIGIHRLVKKGLLRHVRKGESESALDVFFPTPALVSCIMKKQGTAR